MAPPPIVGHLDIKSIDVLGKQNNSSASYGTTKEGRWIATSVRSTRALRWLAPRHIDTSRAWELAFTDLMRSISPTALRGFKYAANITNKYTKLKEKIITK